MSIPYPHVITPQGVATRFADATLVSDYLDAGSPAGELVYLAFGETWTQTAPGLIAALADLPPHAHGYVISQYGLPRLQRALRTAIAEGHRLPADAEPSRDYEVAVTHGGTRTAMFDFARLLVRDDGLSQNGSTKVRPVAIAALPGWDYATVFESVGYRMRYLRVGDHENAAPSPWDIDDAAGTIASSGTERLAAVIINAQHNPTGSNWSEETVRHLVRTAISADAAVLIDDAYFGVHDPALTPTSALRVLLEELRDAPRRARKRWLAVRSLGKQFHCNGWGIGAATAHPETLDALVNTLLFHRGFASAIPLQEAMATWLQDPAADDYLAESGREYAIKRIAVREFLVSRLGYRPDSLQLGAFAPFARIPVPDLPHRRIPPGTDDFRQDCFRRTGVLIGGDRSYGGPHAARETRARFRLFLGPPLPVLMEGLTRIADAGYAVP